MFCADLLSKPPRKRTSGSEPQAWFQERPGSCRSLVGAGYCSAARDRRRPRGAGLRAPIQSVDFTCLDRGNCGYREFKVAWAAHTLAHEAFHLRGLEDEGVTECYALQNTAFVAERLGVAAEQAEKLQTWLFVKGYPNEPMEYHSSGCYDGGPLDLRPEQTEFP